MNVKELDVQIQKERDHYCGCKYSTERINDEIHKDSRKIDKKKTQGMKYLVCT